MAYCTEADILTHISRANLAALCNDSANALDADPVVLSGLIAHASTQINGQLSKLYSTPLADPVPALVNSIAVDIVLFLAYNRQVATFPIPKTIQSEYDNAVQTLSDIAEGRQGITLEPAVVAPEAAITAAVALRDFNDPTNPVSLF